MASFQALSKMAFSLGLAWLLASFQALSKIAFSLCIAWLLVCRLASWKDQAFLQALSFHLPHAAGQLPGQPVVIAPCNSPSVVLKLTWVALYPWRLLVISRSWGTHENLQRPLKFLLSKFWPSGKPVLSQGRSRCGSFARATPQSWSYWLSCKHLGRALVLSCKHLGKAGGAHLLSCKHTRPQVPQWCACGPLWHLAGIASAYQVPSPASSSPILKNQSYD